MEQPRIFRYDTVDSTNTVCKSLAAQGAPSGTAVIARRQTAGRATFAFRNSGCLVLPMERNLCPYEISR